MYVCVFVFYEYEFINARIPKKDFNRICLLINSLTIDWFLFIDVSQITNSVDDYDDDGDSEKFYAKITIFKINYSVKG